MDGGFESLLFRDVLSIATLALFLGLIVHGVLRRSNPELGWGSLGNVWTQPYGALDLPVLAILLLFIHLTVASAGSAIPADAGEEAAGMGLDEVWFQVALSVFLLAALLFFLGFLRQINLSEVFGLTRMGPLKIVGLSLLSIAVAFPLIYLVQLGVNRFVLEKAVGELEPQEAVQLFVDTDDVRLKIVMIFLTCLVAPVAEEFLFRGYIYAVVKRFSDRSFSAIFTSTVFAVVHLNVQSFAPLWVLALCFTIAYELTGCLWVPIAMHAVFNSASVAMILTAPDLL